jgi:signal transduction histidine kinase
MIDKNRINRHLTLGTFALAIVMFVMSMAGNRSAGNTERIAKNARSRVESRIEILEEYIERVAASEDEDFPCLEGLPEDMVIYTYVNDSLKSWSNQFSVLNDDISNKMVFQRLTNLRNRITSPLTEVTNEYSYVNLGPKWYIVKAEESNPGEKIIAGIEIKNTLIDDIRRNENGVNPHLKISDRYDVLPLHFSGGTPVHIYGKPLFKILGDSSSAAPFLDDSLFRWLGLILFAMSTILFLAGHRTLRVYLSVLAIITFLTAISFIWGLNLNGHSDIFSPTTYADGQILFSLGALLLLNTYITLIGLCTYLAKDALAGRLREDRNIRKKRLIIYGAFVLAGLVFTSFYTHNTLCSLLLNSNISLELYRWNSNIPHTAIVYLSYIGLLCTILLFIQMASPVLRGLWGIRIDMFSKKNLTIFSLCCAAYFSITVGILGFGREQERIVVWANRLAVDRDLGLEIRIKAIEEDIAADQIIASLAQLDNAEGIILNRISDNYLSRIRQNYSMNLVMLHGDNPRLIRRYNESLRDGTPISEGSRFMFISDGIGHSKYVGAFAYYTPERGLSRMLLEIEPNSRYGDSGYYSILGKFSGPGDINIPQFYSYAKYSEGRLTSYKGNYPFPTEAEQFAGASPGDEESEVMRLNGYTHFIHKVGENETIIISRPKRSGIVYFTSFSYLFLVMLALVMLFASSEKKTTFKSNYFKTRINTILFITSTMILVSLTVVSVFFVYKRNQENMHNLMSSRINTIQALIETHAKGVHKVADMMSPLFRSSLENISGTTKSDITLYTPEGKVFYSSTPEVFDKMILGNRINQEAYHNIRHLKQRFFIGSESISDFRYWSLYAPILNADRDIVAIVSSPYVEGDYDFRREAFFHAALLINIFLLLLIISLIFSTRSVNEMFEPLIEMGKKMSVADIHKLKPIKYQREDEISSLVEAYNRMVQELNDSTARLAQAERDKAWSQMARQVAHEIKNPLTPIKLEIQRLIRLKENGNPKWEEKFDKVTSVVLEHIDILTETANEFSTFAKLYSEEPVLVDLDKTLRDQILIFDNKENISIGYIGMEEAMVMAPRPQLIRVFVNLIANAVQAVEIRQREMEENDEEVVAGKVIIALRNSNKDGYYDIVVDDNGPGVTEENQSKLFTPNFTTKSGGTGLGLAICRNIIEKCEGSITYSKSFGLGGASFTVTLPKHQ